MMIMKTRTNFVLSSLLCLLLLAAAAVNAQQPTPTPSPSPKPSATPQTYPTKGTTDRQPATPADTDTAGNYTVISSIELGVRALSVDGNNNKYRSDLNYGPGFRLFDSSLLIRTKEGAGGLFDSFLVNSTGFNADPYGSVRVNMEKSHWYRFDGNFRRSVYQNNLLNLALGQHVRDTRHKFGDFDLRLLPLNRTVHFDLGYSLDRNNGTGLTTFDYSNATASRGSASTVRGGDEYAVERSIRTRANEFRLGAEGRVGWLDWGFLQGIRAYADDSRDFLNATALGNNTTNTAILTAFSFDQPMHGRAYFTRANLHTFLAKRLDVTVRYTYSRSHARYLATERDAGRTAGSGSNPLANALTYTTLITTPGETIRPAHLGDVGLTWLVTDKFRISETFRYNTFSNRGTGVYNEATAAFRANGTALFNPSPAVFVVPVNYTLDYHRTYNQIEGDYVFGPRFAFHFGHRYQNRHITTLDLGLITSGQPAPTFVEKDEVFRLHSNNFFGGFKVRPVKAWTIFFDAARGDANDLFTRVDNRQSTNFRVRNRITPRQGLGLNVSFITRNNDNPGETVIDNTLVGPQSTRQFDVKVRDRNFSSSIDWTVPNGRYSLSAGYTHLQGTTDAVIAFFPLPAGCVGTTAVPLPACAAGRSQYYLRDNFFYANMSAYINRRLSAYASYRISRDTGQGNRVTDLAHRLFVDSLPLSFQSPEVRLIFKVNRHIDWNVGYQYYDYKEKFSTAQNYRAHLPYTSLRFYWGGGEK
jgi:hypothetical protein